MRLNDEQNVRFMNDPRRVEAEKALHESVARIRDTLQFDGSAGYYLSTLPPLLKKLADANEHLITVEATVEAEVLGKIPKMFNGKQVITADAFSYSKVKPGDLVDAEVVMNAMDCLPPA